MSVISKKKNKETQHERHIHFFEFDKKKVLKATKQ